MYTYHLPHYQRNPRLPLYICSLKEQDYSDVFFWLKSNTGGAVIAKDKIVAIDEEKGSTLVLFIQSFGMLILVYNRELIWAAPATPHCAPKAQEHLRQ